MCWEESKRNERRQLRDFKILYNPTVRIRMYSRDVGFSVSMNDGEMEGDKRSKERGVVSDVRDELQIRLYYSGHVSVILTTVVV